MSLVTDTWGSNLNPAPKTITIAKTLSATPTTSGTAVTDTKNFFNKDCPFDLEVINIKAVAQAITPAHFNGTSGAVTVTVQRSNEVDTSPSTPTTASWDTLLSSVSCADKSTDELCFDAPGDGTNTLDQTYISVPEGGSLRAVLSAQVENTYVGDGSPVTILVLAECRPTNIKEQRYL